MSLNIFSITTQFWTLKESGALCSLGQGQNFLLSTVEKSCETNSLLQRAVLQILRHSLFNQISTKRNNLNIHPGDILKNHKSTETLQNSFAKTTYSDILSLLSL